MCIFLYTFKIHSPVAKLEKQNSLIFFFRGRSGSLTDEVRLQMSPRRHHHYHHTLHNSSNDKSSELLKLLKR